MSDNSLHFFINGVDVGKKIKTIPPVLYGVVDVFGQAEEVTITGMGVDYFSPSEVYDLFKDFSIRRSRDELWSSQEPSLTRGENRISREYL